jgi:hypothetical protein
MALYYSDKSLSAFATHKKFWDFYKSIIKTKNSSEAQTFANIMDAATKCSVTDPSEIARVFNHHFTNIRCDPFVTDESAREYINECFLRIKRNGSLVVPKVGFSFKHVSVCRKSYFCFG